jgi:hypothetical protein
MGKKKGVEYEATPLGWFMDNLSVPQAQELLNGLYRYLLRIDKNAMVFDKGEITFEKVVKMGKKGMMKWENARVVRN